MRILLVEDDRKGALILSRGLTEEGFTVDLAVDGSEAEKVLKTVPYDLVILDWLLPGKQGIDVCRDLRRRDAATPILMLTALDAVEDRIEGLDTGADDYLTKPYAFWELLARIRALLRRSKHARSPLLMVADLTLDPVTHEVTRDGRVIDLTEKEYDILNALARHAGRVMMKTELTRLLWGEDLENVSNLLEVHISHLRKKIDDGASILLIRTVRGRGYCLGGERT
jgi:DNA-binding response OmpR family regulator